jgi:cytochrome b561
MYFLMVAIPLAGWGMSSAADRPVSFFRLFEIPLLPVTQDKATVDLFHESHEVLAKAMLVLFVLHVAAALKHHLVDRDGTLRRMAPWMK